MAAKLDGATLVHVDVSRLDSQHALIGLEQGINHGGVGLRATHEEKHVGIGFAACRADFLPGSGAVIIQSVARGTVVVGLNQALEDSLVAAVVVVTLK